MDVAVLGSLEIVTDGARLAVTSATQRRTLAALVVSRGEVLASERLAEMVGVSLQALRTAISRFRAEMGEGVIVTQPEGYTLGLVNVDADRFEALLEVARQTAPEDAVDALDSALQLWRGDPYAECVDTEWAPPAAARLAELWSSAIEDRGEWLIVLGRFGDAAAAMSAHTSQHPLRDRPVELLMRALAAQGRQTEALRQFRDYRRRLVDEIGVEPGAKLVELDARIAGGWHETPPADIGLTSSLDDEPGGNLRPHLTSFVGRDSEVGEVIRSVAQHRLVTLIGVGGVGKTRLAIESALKSGRWPHGAWLVELGSVEDGDDVADAVARTLGIRQSSGLSSSESVLRWCEQREMLLILDNCEHVLRASARLAEALTATTDAVSILATSREALMVPGEHVRPVSTLALPDEESGTHGAAELFIDRAQAELSSFCPNDHRTAIVSICHRLDGLPLALELAAARVRGLSVEDIASRLDERFRLLTGGRRTAVERHATLRATVDWSYDMLSEIERTVFCSLAVFAGPFTLDDAIAMTGDDIDELDAIDAIAHLADRSLIIRGDTSPEYRLLETLRAYGRERLNMAEEADLTGRRHAELMASKAAQARSDAAGPRENDVVAMLRAQMVDYGSAVKYAAQRGDYDTAVRIAEDLYVPTMSWGDSGPVSWMCPLLDEQFSSASVAAVNRWMASVWNLFFGNDRERANSLSTEAVNLDPSCAIAHGVCALGALLTGRPDDAVLAVDAAERLECDAGEQQFVLMVRGNALLLAGDVAEAASLADRFIIWAEERQIPTAMALAHHLKGRTVAESDLTAAQQSFERGLKVVRERIPECVLVEIMLKREMIPIVYGIDRSDALELAWDVVRKCVRHNETGNLLSSLAYAAIMLADGSHDDVAAAAIGAAGLAVLAPRDTESYEKTKQQLEARLGQRYEQLVDDGSRMPVMSTAQSVIGALGSLRTHLTS